MADCALSPLTEWTFDGRSPMEGILWNNSCLGEWGETKIEDVKDGREQKKRGLFAREHENTENNDKDMLVVLVVRFEMQDRRGRGFLLFFMTRIVN